jgi:hypothetical protein
MIHILPVCAILFALPPAGKPDEPAVTIIRLTVDATPAPRPALKYQLLPELREMQPGNPIFGYLRCFAEQNPFFFSKQAMDEREKWSEMPLKDLPVKDMRGYGGNALRQADYAARLDTPDWQILPKLKSEGINLLLPDVQWMRNLAWALQVRCRGEVADRRFDDALRSLKTMFALSRHLADHPTLIADLVGIAVGAIATGNLDEMIGQPGCPNLYWALTNLPRPFIDLRRGLQGERMMLDAEAALISESEPMTPAQVQKALERASLVVALAGLGDGVAITKELRRKFYALVNDEAYVRAARRRLVEAGLDAAKVKQFSATQVVLLDEKHKFEADRDDRLKAMNLPFWEAHAILARVQAIKGVQEKSLGALLLPNLLKVRMAQARLEQRLALLRCVEVLRLYAAAHDGKLPAKLADVGVPLPVDPVTGKAFVYRLEGATASVRGTAPHGLERSAPFNVRYEVTIRK